LFNAACSASSHKVVKCEQCGKEYVYQVWRHGQGEAFNALFLDEEAAKRLAAQRANHELQTALREAIEIVPCPGCGWIQDNMKSLAQQRHLRRVKIAGAVVLSFLIVPIVMLIGAFNMPTDEPATPSYFAEIALMTLMSVVIGGGLLLARSMACKQFDPNDEDVDVRLCKVVWLMLCGS
jgi:hypothetical protein